MSLIPNDFVRFLLPQLVHAGRYTAQIQRSINTRPAKAGENLFQQALTDGDLTVQAFLEVLLLSRYPDVAFYSEEQDQSLNAKYFPKKAEFEVLIDPIDGTRAYLDGTEKYQIIVTLRDRVSIAAAICYMPRRESSYVAIRGEGAMVYSAQVMESSSGPTRPLSLSDLSRKVILFNAPEIRAALAGKFETIDILDEYQRTGMHHGFTELFEGGAAACIHPNPQLIDAGAIAFIAREAGGHLTTLTGEPVNFQGAADRRLPGTVASASKAFHEEILAALKHATSGGR